MTWRASRSTGTATAPDSARGSADNQLGAHRQTDDLETPLDPTVALDDGQVGTGLAAQQGTRQQGRQPVPADLARPAPARRRPTNSPGGRGATAHAPDRILCATKSTTPARRSTCPGPPAPRGPALAGSGWRPGTPRPVCGLPGPRRRAGSGRAAVVRASGLPQSRQRAREAIAYPSPRAIRQLRLPNENPVGEGIMAVVLDTTR